MDALTDLLRALAFAWRRATWRFRRPPMPKNPGGAVFVHVGCGALVDPRFVNVDVQPYRSVHLLGTGARLGLADRSVDVIYASHVLEHFGRRETRDVLAEWYRVLKRGGVLLVSVPDFGKLATMYVNAALSLKDIEAFVMGSQGNRYDLHRSAFDRPTLTASLHAAGFDAIREWSDADYAAYPFDDYAHHSPTRSISVSLRAEKG